MIDCCPFCCEKYINEDGSIDKKKLLELQTQAFAERRIRYKPDGKATCMCNCHVKGKEIFH